MCNTNNSIPIEEFNLEKMVENPSIVMIAKRGSGKSWVAKALLYHFRKIPMGVVIAPTDRMNSFYANFFPDSFIHYSYKSSIIQNLLMRQTKIIEKNKERKNKGLRSVDPRAWIVMDDCLASKSIWANDASIKELLFNGRHYNIMYILTMQYPLGIDPNLRTNFDYIFLLAEDFNSNVKRIYDHYAGMFPTFDAFKQVFFQLTDNYGAMVIANRGARKNFLEKIYWYKAPDLESINFKIGCKQFNKFHDRNYNQNWRVKSEDKVFNIDEYYANKKKGNAKIAINKCD